MNKQSVIFRNLPSGSWIISKIDLSWNIAGNKNCKRVYTMANLCRRHFHNTTLRRWNIMPSQIFKELVKLNNWWILQLFVCNIQGNVSFQKQLNLLVEFLNPCNATGITSIILKPLGKVNRDILFRYPGLIILKFDQKLKRYEKETNIVKAQFSEPTVLRGRSSFTETIFTRVT